MLVLLSFGFNWRIVKDCKNPFLDRDAYDSIFEQTIFLASDWTAKNPSIVTNK